MISVFMDDFIPVDPTRPPGFENFTTIVNWVAWGVALLAVIGILITAGRIAINHRRGEGSEEAMGLGWSLFALILIGSVGALVGALV